MRRKRHLCVIAASLLLAAACGARLTDEQTAALQDASSTGDAPQSTVTSIVGSGPTETTQGGGRDAGGDGPSTTAGSDRPATPADQEGSDNGGGVEVGGSSCAGGGASDVGVTAEEIRIGNVSTISGPIPGFGQTGVNAVKAYVNMVNANGGVCGRKLTLVTADDRLQSGTNKSETDKLAQEVIGFVGGTTVVDGGAAQSYGGTNIADTGLAISEEMIVSSNNFPTVPINVGEGGNNASSIFRYMKKVEGVSKAALVWPAQASAKARMDGYKQALDEAGIDIVVQKEVAVVETNYADEAKNIESAEADLVITTLELSGMANLAKAMQQNGYFPKVPFYGAQVYGQAFLTQAGSAAEGTKVGLGYSILEDAPTVPAIGELIQWYERTNPGSAIDFFAIQAWAAADMYVDALGASQGPPTRDKVFSYLRGLNSFDADGVIADINPAAKTTKGCFMVAEVSGGTWRRAHPASGFDCSHS